MLHKDIGGDINLVLNINNDRNRKIKGKIILALCVLSVVITLLSLSMILSDAILDGLPWLDFQFISSYPSRFDLRLGDVPELQPGWALLRCPQLGTVSLGR